MKTIGIFFHRIVRAGGAERMVCLLANELSHRGFLVCLITLDAESSSSFYPLNPTVEWVKIGFYDGVFDKLRRTIHLYSVLKKYNVGAFLGFVISGDKTCFIASKLANVKLLAAERNAPDMYWLRYSAFQRWLCFLFLNFSDRIIIQFPRFANKYPARLRSRIVSISNPVPLAGAFAQPERKTSSGRFVLLAVSRLDDIQKRISCLVCAFSLISSECQDWDLVIVGDGPDEAKITSLVRKLGLQSRVFLKRSTKDVFSAYLNANLFVTPSLWEGFPNSLAEAMSHGLPSVGFAEAAGVSDLISESSGWLAPGRDDSTSLADTLRQAMMDSGERMCRGKEAVKRMSEFQPKRQLDCWESLLIDVMGAPG